MKPAPQRGKQTTCVIGRSWATIAPRHISSCVTSGELLGVSGAPLSHL